MSCYRPAIDLIAATINRRAKYYRNLILTLVALALGSLCWAAVARSPSPLSGLLLLAPACGFFFVLDARLLDQWRSRLLVTWVKRDIDFQALHDAVSAVPTLPKSTLRSMLSTLPSVQDQASEQSIASSTREGVAAALAGIYGCQLDTVRLKATASVIVSVSVVAAASRRDWKVLLGSLAVILIPLLGKWLKRRRMALWRQRTIAAKDKPGFRVEECRQLIASVDEYQILRMEFERLVDV